MRLSNLGSVHPAPVSAVRHGNAPAVRAVRNVEQALGIGRGGRQGSNGVGRQLERNREGNLSSGPFNADGVYNTDTRVVGGGQNEVGATVPPRFGLRRSCKTPPQ